MEIKKWNVEYLSDVLRKDIPKISSNKNRLKKFIENKLIYDPYTLGKPLKYSLSHLRSARVGDYRIIYNLQIKSSTILIVKIGHRKEVYKG